MIQDPGQQAASALLPSCEVAGRITGTPRPRHPLRVSPSPGGGLPRS
jgi:hypothetical protein